MGVVGIWATIKSCIQLNDWTRQAVKTTRTLREESLDIRTTVGKIKTKKISDDGQTIDYALKKYRCHF